MEAKQTDYTKKQTDKQTDKHALHATTIPVRICNAEVFASVQPCKLKIVVFVEPVYDNKSD